MIEEAAKAKCFNSLYDAARRLEEPQFKALAGAHLTFGTLGITLTMIRDIRSGEAAHAEYLMAWEEIALTKFDLLDDLITDMYDKITTSPTLAEEDKSFDVV